MKKLTLTGLVAAGVLLTTACSEDNTFQPQPGEGGNVTFTIQLPAEGLGSRAFADGKTANDLVYAIYDAETDALIAEDATTFAAGELKKTVNISLANGKSYKIAFFAHNATTGVYTFDAANTSLSVDYTKMAEYNTADHDAFYKLHETGLITDAVNQEVKLYRPLAQINWGTSDLNEPAVTAAYGQNAANLKTEVTFKGVYTKFNLLTGERDETTTEDVTFTMSARPSGETYPVTGYEYLSMNYILAKDDSSTADAELTVNNTDAAPVVVSNMPFQANYRTNIYGALLTVPGVFNVEKVPGFADGDNNIAAPVQEVATPEEFVKAIANPGVATVKLTEDIDLSAATVEELTISGKKEINIAEGKTVSLGAENYFDLVAGADVTINGGTITNSEAGLPTTPGATKGLIHATDAVLTIEGTTLVNDMDFHNHGNAGLGFPYNASAVSYWGECDIVINNAEVYSGGYTVCGMGRNVNTSKLKMTNSHFESNSSNIHGNYAYNQRIFAAESVMEKCTVIGVQGGVSLEHHTMIFRDCNISTHNTDGQKDAFYAIYVTNNGVAQVESGEYSGAVNRSEGVIDDMSALVSGNNDVGLPSGSFILKGGKYSGKAYNHVTKEIYEPAEGYMYKAIEGDDVYKWEVVPVPVTE